MHQTKTVNKALKKLGEILLNIFLVYVILFTDSILLKTIQ